MKAHHSLTEIAWSDSLASLLAESCASISRLDARISASSLRDAWMARAVFPGFTAALRAQHIELEEIDVFSAHFGLKLLREVDRREFDVVERLPVWAEALTCKAEAIDCLKDRHWNENLPFTFDQPPNWGAAPRIVRALEIISFWSQKCSTIDPWLAMPRLLQSMDITTNALPCLAGGDPAFRYMPHDREANLRRSLKRLTRSAVDGSTLMDVLEAWTRDMKKIIATESRPTSLKLLALMVLGSPVISPKLFSDRSGISLSGAGKLLKKVENLGLLQTITSAVSWKSYIARDTALRLNIIKPVRGRPSNNRLPPPSVDDILARFDADMLDFSQTTN